MPFSSYIQIELHKNNSCVAEHGDKKEKCYLMRFMSNGIALQLKGLKADEKTGFSKFDTAKKFLTELSYKNKQFDMAFLEKECQSTL